MAAPVVESNGTPVRESDLGDQILTLTKPAGTAEGDLLIAQLEYNFVGTNYTSSGWTELIHEDRTSCSINIMYKVAGASEPATYNFTADETAGSSMQGAITRISGADGTSFDTPTGANTSGTSLTLPDATTTVDDSLVLRCIFSHGNVFSGGAQPAGHTVLWETVPASGTFTGQAWKNQASAGSVGTVNWGGLDFSYGIVGVTVLIKPAVTGDITDIASTGDIAITGSDVETFQITTQQGFVGQIGITGSNLTTLAFFPVLDTLNTGDISITGSQLTSQVIEDITGVSPALRIIMANF